MRIHVFEFICGGGLAGLPLPPHMAREGDLMLTALLDDLRELPGVQVSFARDARLSLPPAAARPPAPRPCWRVPGAAAPDALAREIAHADATWPVAPETGGELERAARAVLQADRVLLGARPEAIALAASKSATARRLAQAGVAAVPCFAPGSRWDPIDGAWVVKPDDGAGCADTQVFSSRREAAVAVEDGRPGLIAQPWIEGEAMSLCVLAAPQRVQVASLNRQRLQVRAGAVELAAIDVNCAPVTAPLGSLAERVAAAVPGLHGYFGIDFVQTAAGPVVLEVNPRLTSSYAGLRAALGLNVARWVVGAAVGDALPALGGHPGRTVTLSLAGDGID